MVAMSRARLGLYIFARVSLFENCFELTPAFKQLTARPLQLHIRPHEYYSQEQPVCTSTCMLCSLDQLFSRNPFTLLIMSQANALRSMLVSSSLNYFSIRCHSVIIIPSATLHREIDLLTSVCRGPL